MSSASIINGSTRPYRNGRGEASECRCPVCSSIISPDLLASIIGAENARTAEIEKAVEARFAKQIAAAERARKAEIAKAVREATAVAEQKLAAIRTSQSGVVAAAVAKEHEKTAKLVADAVAVAKVEHATEKARLEADLRLLQTKLAARPAHQIGEPAEVDLFDALVAAFPTDRISRVPKGVKGPDVIVDVICDGGIAGTGELAGRIYLDSKAHARWSNRFTKKLAEDGRDADFCILSTSVMPAGAQQLHIQDGVIVAAPERIVVLVQLLRRQIIDNHVRKLGLEARNEKADAMLAFLLSRRSEMLFEKWAAIGRDLDALQVVEIKDHERLWQKRSELVRAATEIHDTITTTIADIIGGGGR